MISLPHSSELVSFPTRRSSDLAGGRSRPAFRRSAARRNPTRRAGGRACRDAPAARDPGPAARGGRRDRKSTRLNSSHGYISYAVFCLKKKNSHGILHAVEENSP